jgi:hypothetical protein
MRRREVANTASPEQEEVATMEHQNGDLEHGSKRNPRRKDTAGTTRSTGSRMTFGRAMTGLLQPERKVGKGERSCPGPFSHV